ncbi:hypothetical protein HY256_04005 [Candidatus Sumerlaeota bacterium]|nr:hypothetical protein [Candidatus Sumerlaeota bacterium]
MNGFARAADNMRPLIAAIEEFKTKNGSLPPNLEALVPGYIKEIPSTGLSLYPKVEYWTKLTGGLGGNEWGLIIRASHNPFNFDTFNYLPLHNYPDWYGGMTERVGDWAYVHE